jgi:hypothetical protein
MFDCMPAPQVLKQMGNAGLIRRIIEIPVVETHTERVIRQPGPVFGDQGEMSRCPGKDFLVRVSHPD